MPRKVLSAWSFSLEDVAVQVIVPPALVSTCKGWEMLIISMSREVGGHASVKSRQICT